MAGRIVVLEFDDRDAANMFASNEVLSQQLGYKPVGIYLLPDKFCECPDKQRQNVKNWRRGKRSGLWLCIRCKKPSVFHRKGLLERLGYHFGYNQLEFEHEDV